MTSAVAITLAGVTRHYATPAGTVRAVDGISLEVEAGSSLALTGPSGCGKSTLLGLIGGLDVPTAGQVVVAGHEVSSLPERQRARLRRRHIGFLFQTDNLLAFLTAGENVALQSGLHGGGGDGDDLDDGRCLETLAELGLAEEVDKLPDQLSGGQRQRVAVARALIHRPSVILADEPTGSVDAASAVVVLDLLLTAQAQTGATLVVVTHDQTVAERLDRTLALRDGRLVGAVTTGDQRDGGA